MKFRTRRTDEPEINLIPFIDVLLVVLIFVMLSASFTMGRVAATTITTVRAAKLDKFLATH